MRRERLCLRKLPLRCKAGYSSLRLNLVTVCQSDFTKIILLFMHKNGFHCSFGYPVVVKNSITMSSLRFASLLFSCTRNQIRNSAISATYLQTSRRSLQTTDAVYGRLTTFSRKDREQENAWPEPKEWPLKNAVIYPPQETEDHVRRAEYFHHRSNIKYSPKKMWYICCLIRGMTVDEAIKQLSFIPKKGAVIMKEVLEEAREVALKEHNFELKSDMFIGQVS